MAIRLISISVIVVMLFSQDKTVSSSQTARPPANTIKKVMNAYKLVMSFSLRILRLIQLR